MTENVIELTRLRLIGHRGRYREISNRCGFSYSWLSKFARGERGFRPSYDLINRLQDELDKMDDVAGAANGAVNGGERRMADRRDPAK